MKRYKKVISFGLWGSLPMYVIGAIENIKLAKQFYPGWICRFYCDKDFSQKFIDKIIEAGIKNDVQIEIIKYVPKITQWEGLFYRFLSFDDPECEVTIIRDLDSRFTNREVSAVNEWLNSEFAYHGMRDHEAHGIEILGCAFGFKCGFFDLNMKEEIDKYLNQNKLIKGSDQFFLRDVVWPIVKDDSLVHDEFFTFTGREVPFPIKRNGEDDYVGKPYHLTALGEKTAIEQWTRASKGLAPEIT